MINKRFFYVFVFMLFIPFSFALESIGSYKLNDCISLPQTCNNCTYVNITSIRYPNSTVALSNVAMTKSGTDYNYTFCGNTVIGDYIVSFVGDLNGIQDTESYYYSITELGSTLDISKTMGYVIIYVICISLFVGLLILGIFLPSYNKRDELSGYIIALSNLKYVKIFSILCSYLVMVFILFLTYSISRAYLDLNFVTQIFRTLFLASTIFLLPLFIMSAYFMIANWIKDSQVAELLSRGLTVK